MMTIELCGPSGAGKSAIYEKMLEHGGFIKNPKIDGKQAIEICNEAKRRYPQLAGFMSLLDYTFRRADGQRNRTRRYGVHRALAKLIIAAEQTEDNNIMVIDGGLVHRGQSIDQTGSHAPLIQYFQCMPAPSLIVNMTCNLDVLKERNIARGGSHDRSMRCARSVEVANTARNILAKRGVPILTLDTTHTSPAKNAEAILKRIGLLEVDETTRGARQYKGEDAELYEQRRKNANHGKWEIEQRIVEDMLSDLPAGSWVLDAPCGTGRFFDFYAGKGFIVRGLDREADMIAQAAAKIKNPVAKIGDHAQWQFFHRDVLDGVPLPDKSVDAVANIRITRWLQPEDCQEMFREMQRISRDRIIITARVANHPHARPLQLFELAMSDDWELERSEAGYQPEYRIFCFKRKRAEDAGEWKIQPYEAA